jgi:hypothetical protein
VEFFTPDFIKINMKIFAEVTVFLWYYTGRAYPAMSEIENE